jgi:hypothetical protein
VAGAITGDGDIVRFRGGETSSRSGLPPTDATIEQRLEAVEVALAELQRKLAVPSPSPDRLKPVTGSF